MFISQALYLPASDDLENIFFLGFCQNPIVLNGLIINLCGEAGIICKRELGELAACMQTSSHGLYYQTTVKGYRQHWKLTGKVSHSASGNESIDNVTLKISSVNYMSQ